MIRVHLKIGKVLSFRDVISTERVGKYLLINRTKGCTYIDMNYVNFTEEDNDDKD